MEEEELLKHIYQDAAMGKYTLEVLTKDLKEKDNKLKGAIEDILKEYESFFKTSKNYLLEKKKEPKEKNILAKMGASMGIHKEVKSDNSDASIAEMLIQGISMGSLEMEKKLKAYDKEIDKKYQKLTDDFLTFQQNAIEKLKAYL